MSAKIRVSREEKFLKDKKISDRVYMILFSMAQYVNGSDRRELPKKQVNFTKLANIYPITRQTLSKHCKELILKGLIIEEKDKYIVPNPAFYYDVDRSTIDTLKSGLTDNAIKIYVFLLGWDSHCKKQNTEFNFSYDFLCETIGLAKHQTNRNMIKGIIEILERLELIKVSAEADFPVLINGTKTMHHRLIYARDALPKRN